MTKAPPWLKPELLLLPKEVTGISGKVIKISGSPELPFRQTLLRLHVVGGRGVLLLKLVVRRIQTWSSQLDRCDTLLFVHSLWQ